MISTLFYIYLTGWIGITTYGSYNQCYKEHGGSMSESECYKFMIGAGAIWPVIGYNSLKERF